MYLYQTKYKVGFSLVELMTVISLAALVLAVTFPVFTSIDRGTRIASSVNLLKGVLSSTQRHAQRDIPDKEVPGASQSVPYRGGAVLVEEVEEGDDVRIQLTIMEHDQRAKGFVGAEERVLGEWDEPKVGFKPIYGLDPVKLPVGAGLVGVIRDGDKAFKGIKYVWPPFAFHFSQRGKIVTGHAVSDFSNADDRVVLVDIDDDRRYGEKEDNGDGNFTNEPTDIDEILNAVTFVALFDRTKFEAEGYTSEAFLTNYKSQHNTAKSQRNWLKDNSKLLYVNRFSGVIMRENGVGETLVND